ncbi:hypothetical protein BU14_0082s0017 [Porphyra umbilicalis]|uniref:Alpha-1,3/1,6-mannosyltransferase ALG2 n=1 Tax=Porphyra umbilicalis TaxID=2786 RepID=A0A1X6PEG4_PORUM|nr:hypothetical protein BU14_0082s0017 [Porphyra umbilicalis]|eukprot:OSX79252.1 hypothetical protein BU14_0082s0017 [Porphyra umbilicalis]
MRVAFLHPDLGLGGAERLIIDAATALAARGHGVTIYTAARDGARCFADVHPDRPAGAVPAVVVLPPPIPRTVAGGGAAVLAAARMTALAAVIVATGRPDVVVVDQVAAPVLLLRAAGVPTVFYCHYPDVDAAGVAAADAVGVNSEFTRAAYGRAYPGAPAPAVVYPAVRAVGGGGADGAAAAADAADADAPLTLLSINRYERKKNIPLALETLAHLLRPDGGGGVALPPGAAARLRLLHMGGYDERLSENVQHHDELAARAAAPDLAGRVTLAVNAADAEVAGALACATALLYTPTDEHFGIVPLQAAAAGLPVVAVAAGGPLETVADGVTGWLVPPTAAAFAGAVGRVLAAGGGGGGGAWPPPPARASRSGKPQPHT